MASRLEVTGEVKLSPSTPTGPGGAYATVALDVVSRNYGAQDSGAFSVSGTTQLSPGAVAAIRFLAIRALDGQAMVALVSSSSGGADQGFPFSDLLLLNSPSPGDPIASVKLVGAGRIEYVIAGDTTLGSAPVVRSSTVATVDTLAELSALPTAAMLAGGTIVVVRENNKAYRLDGTSGLPQDIPNGIVDTFDDPALQWFLFG